MCGEDGLRAGADDAWRWDVKLLCPIDDFRRCGCGRGCMLLSSNVTSSIFASSRVSICVVFEPSEVLKLWKLTSALEYARDSKPT